MPKTRIPYWIALTTGVVSEFLADDVTCPQPKAPLMTND